jgi:hypothetical protein
MSIAVALTRYNELAAAAGKKPLLTWKQSLAKLQERIAQLTPATAEQQPVEPQKETEMASKKTPAKKTPAKKTKADKPAAERTLRTDTLSAFVRAGIAKDKAATAIYEEAIAKGFDTTSKSVASMVCRYKKQG